MTAMASSESNNSDDRVCQAISKLERLVEVWKNLRTSDENVELITYLIKQKLVGLGAFTLYDIQGTSTKDLGRSLDLRNTIIEFDICKLGSNDEHWQILDAFLNSMIMKSSSISSGECSSDHPSDLDCLGILENWATLASMMTKYPLASPGASIQLDLNHFQRVEPIVGGVEQKFLSHR